MNDHSKVTADHLRRDAYLYVRQSSLYQVATTPSPLAVSTTCAAGRSRWAGPPIA
jgi:hypothetical protein